MSNLEINWWDKMRGDGTDPNDPATCYGKMIQWIELESLVPDGPTGEMLVFMFTDGARLAISDAGQQCCEHRYLSADGDTFDHYMGANLVGLELKSAPDGDEDIVFLDVLTSAGTFTLSAHNEHNGYYSGFDIIARVTLP